MPSLANREAAAGRCREALEHVLLRLPVREVLGGYGHGRALVAQIGFVYSHKSIRLVKRQTAQDDGVDHGEDGGRGTDPERQDGQRDKRETWRRKKRAQ